MCISRETCVAAANSDAASNPNSGSPDGAKKGLDNIDNRIDNANLQNRRAQLDKIINLGLQRMDEKKVKYTIAGHEFVLQDQIAQAAGLVQGMKDFVGEAVKASPEASLAWAGVCVILPILTNPSAAEQANSDGFIYVVSRMHFYVQLERLLWPANLEQVDKLKKEFEDHIVDLYRHILDFQLKSVLRFYRSRLGNLGRDLIQHEDWKGMLSTINNKEAIVRNDSEQINTISSRQQLEGLSEKAKASLQNVRKLLSVATQILQVLEDNRDILLKHSQTGEQQLKVLKQIARYVDLYPLRLLVLLTAKQRNPRVL